MSNSLIQSDPSQLLMEFDKQFSSYKYLCEVVSALIARLLDASHIEVHSISSRCKDRTSLENKIAKKSKYTSLAEITDLAGIRIITHYGDDVDKVARVIGKEFKVDRENTLDKRIATDPDRFGYVSLHYVVSLSQARSKLLENISIADLKVEIQIRSILQHAWAEIEHDTGYKSEREVPSPIRRKFSRLAGLLELADQEFISIRNELVKYSKRVASEVNQKAVNVDIDSVSFDAFILNNELSLEVDRELADSTGHGLVVNQKKRYAKQINRLRSVGIESIGELVSALKIHRSDIVNLAVDVFSMPLVGGGKHSNSPLDFGISSFYLCHILAAKRSEDFLDMYLDDNNWNKDADAEAFRQLLLRYTP